MTKREKSLMMMDLMNISSCEINNLMIDVGNICKELDSDNECPVKYRYLMKGIYESIYNLRSTAGNKISDFIKKMEEESTNE